MLLNEPLHRGATEILLDILAQAKALTALVNKSLKMAEEDAIRAIDTRKNGETDERLETSVHRRVSRGEKLVEITIGISKQLTYLLQMIQVKRHIPPLKWLKRGFDCI